MKGEKHGRKEKRAHKENWPVKTHWSAHDSERSGCTDHQGQDWDIKETACAAVEGRWLNGTKNKYANYCGN